MLKKQPFLPTDIWWFTFTLLQCAHFTPIQISTVLLAGTDCFIKVLITYVANPTVSVHSIQAVFSISLETPTFLFTFGKKWSLSVLLEGQAAVLHHSSCSRSVCYNRPLQPCRPSGVTRGAGRCASTQYRATEAAGWSSKSPQCPQVLHLLQAVTSGSPAGPVGQLELQARPPKSKCPWCLWKLQTSHPSDWVEHDLLGWGWDWDGK